MKVFSLRASALGTMMCLLLVLPGSASAHAGSEMAWFSYQFLIDAATLPEGIVATPDPSLLAEGYGVRLNNPTSEPLYIVEIIPGDTTTYRNSGLPPSVKPLYKLVSNKKYAYDPVQGWLKQTIIPTEGKEIDAKDFVIDENVIQMYGGTITNFYTPNRPETKTAPPPDPFVIKAYWKNKPVDIKGSIVYDLNHHYKNRTALANHDEPLPEPITGTFQFAASVGNAVSLLSSLPSNVRGTSTPRELQVSFQTLRTGLFEKFMLALFGS